MNISVTNNKMLKGLVALAVVCASAQAFAALPTSDDFESYAGLEPITNEASTVWTNQGNGQSTVVTNDYSYDGDLPLPDPHTKVLALDTQGDELSYVPATGDAPKVYIDQMVYLVPSDTEPTITDDSVQAALYLNSSSNLVVYCRETNDTGNAWVVLDGTNVIPETWVRLTITMDYDSGDDTFFGTDTDWLMVKVDGNEVTASLGYTGAVAQTGLIVPTGGSWLRAANLSGGTATLDELNGLSYTGTGMIDDLVITDTDPFDQGTGPSTYNVKSVVGANGKILPDITGTTEFDVAIGTSTSLTFKADTYYEIEKLEINGLPVTDGLGNPIVFSNNNHIAELTVDYLDVDVSNHVWFTETLSNLSGAPDSWLDSIGLSAAGEDGTTPYTYLEGYLAGVDPTVSNAFEITSFETSNGWLTVTWDGVDSPAPAGTPSTISAIVSDTVSGLTDTNAGTATFSGGVWTWDSADDTYTNGVLFIKLEAKGTYPAE